MSANFEMLETYREREKGQLDERYEWVRESQESRLGGKNSSGHLALLAVLMDGFEEVGEEVAILSWQLRKYV